MGAMGRYIDGLSDGARDRLIAAPAWLTDELVDGCGAGCLRGHAEGLAATGMSMNELRAAHKDLESYKRLVDVDAARWFFRFPVVPPFARNRANPAGAYNRSVERFGLDRVVRAIKLRAARLNGSDAATIATLTAATTPTPASGRTRSPR